MGRNEIRLRRQMMSTRRMERHRNYADLMARHERDTRMKRIIRVFYYFLIILFLLIILITVIRWEHRHPRNENQKPNATAGLHTRVPAPENEKIKVWPSPV